MIPFYKPNITEEDVQAVADVVRSGRLVTGEKVKELEEKFAEYVGAPYALAVDSLTSGYLLLLDFLNPSSVILPSCTYVSMAAITKKFGIPLSFSDEWVVGRAYKIETDRGTIYDSAHEIHKDICKGDEAGYWLFSLHGTKIVTAGSGGIIALFSKDHYEYLRTLRDSGRLHFAERYDYTVQTIGWNQEFTDIQAALCLSQLGRVEELLEKRRTVSKKLSEKITPRIGDQRSDYLYQIVVDDFSDFAKFVKGKIAISRHFYPLHKQPAFEIKAPNQFPKSNFYGTHLVSIPFYPDMTDEEINTVGEIINEWRKNENSKD